MRETNHWPGLFGSAAATKDGVTLCPAISKISAVSERMTDGKRANAFEDIAALSDWIHGIGSTLDAAEVVRCCGRDKFRYVRACRMYVHPPAPKTARQDGLRPKAGLPWLCRASAVLAERRNRK